MLYKFVVQLQIIIVCDQETIQDDIEMVNISPASEYYVQSENIKIYTTETEILKLILVNT